MATTPLPVHGVDISHHQSGTLDLAGAKRRGLKWLYHKATEGNSFVDSNYNKRRAEAKAAGLPFGAYHFARAEKGDAVTEARHFIGIAKPVPGDLRPALDLETMEGMGMTALREWAAAFIAEVERLTKVKPVVYTPFDLGWADNGCLIWRPRYNDSNTPPVLPYDIWQFSNGVLGKPDHLEGIGAVDLNFMRPGLSLDSMLIPSSKPKSKLLHLMHVSLQVQDHAPQISSDVNKIFTRAKERRVAWITGTEAFGPKVLNPLQYAAANNGYRIAHHPGYDAWVAVRRSMVDGNWIEHWQKVVEGGGDHRDLGVFDVSFDNDELGHFSIFSEHLLTSRQPNAAAKNRRVVEAVGARARRVAAGRALAFVGSDKNMNDRLRDTFPGTDFTSLGDELKKYEPTHPHGKPIDVIGTWDHDGRVSAEYLRVLDDTEFRLFGDHFVVEGGINVRLLPV